MYTPIENHADRMAGLLVQQFREQERLDAFVRALATTQQEAEDATWLVATERWLSSADGAQLDGLGEILGEARQGRSDLAYRIWLYFRVLINACQGTPNEMLDILQFVTSAGGLLLPVDDVRVRYWENWPAGFQLFTDGPFIPGMPDPELAGPLALDDTGLLILDDTGELHVTTWNPDILNSLLDLMTSVAPVAVGVLPIGFSLGEYAFIVAGDFLPVPFLLDDGGALELDDGGQMEVLAGDTAETEGGGFAEIVASPLELDDGGYLELDSGDILGVVDAENPEFETDGAGALIDVMQG